MARYLGPRTKVCRRLGVVLPGLTTAATLVRPYPPGQQGLRRRGKVSDYKMRLIEKQKVRFHFGVMEKQFKNYVVQAVRRKGPTGQNLALLLESRLDNVVWRMGIAATIPAARQLVNHGHFLLNGTKTDIPSAQIKPGDVVEVRNRSKDLEIIKTSLAQPSLPCKPS